MKRREFIRKSSAAVATTLALPWVMRRPAFADELELLVPGELSSATEGVYPPFSFTKDDGTLDGLEMRAMREICGRLGLNYKPVVIKWESMLVALLADKYDVVGSAMGITEERQKSVTFCDGWVESGARLIVHQDSTIQSSADAEGKSIGVITASIFVPLAEGWGAEVRHYPSDVGVMQDTVNRRIDGAVMDSIAAAYAIQVSKMPLRWTDELHIPYQLGWAVKKAKPNLVSAINAARAEMVADGTFGSLVEDLIGFDPSPADPIRSILN
jgi:polar amino acid transport system substrate-binding protein